MLRKLVRMVSVFVLCLVTACASWPANASIAERQMSTGVELQSPMFGSSWSGVVVDSVEGEFGWNTTVLTIIHDSWEARLLISMGAYPIIGKIGGSDEVHSYKVIKWDNCSEVALLSVVLDKPVETAYLADWMPRVGQEVSTVGSPLGEGLKYGRGLISALNTYAYSCSVNEKQVVLDSTSVGVSPGQTGSPLYNENGRIVGLVTAVSLFPVIVQDEEGDAIGITGVPVYYMGLYVNLETIKEVLKLSLL